MLTADQFFALVGLSLATLGIVVAAMLYALPSIVATYRKHPQLLSIALLNLLLGWSFIGWVAALVWSTSKSHTGSA